MGLSHPATVFPFTEGAFWPTGRTFNGRATFCVTEAFTYIPGEITIPAGFVFDGPSVPWWSLPFVPVGEMFLPAALHDWLIADKSIPRKTTDYIFHQALLEVGFSPTTACLMYLAVRSNSLKLRIKLKIKRIKTKLKR